MPYIIGAVGTAELVDVVSQSGAILVHFIGPRNPQTAQSFDKLRMKSKGLRTMVGGRSFDRLRMKSEGLRMMVGGAKSFDRLRMMVGGQE